MARYNRARDLDNITLSPGDQIIFKSYGGRESFLYSVEQEIGYFGYNSRGDNRDIFYYIGLTNTVEIINYVRRLNIIPSYGKFPEVNSLGDLTTLFRHLLIDYQKTALSRFDWDDYVPKGDMAGYDKDIIKKLCEEQVEQGNIFDPTVFEYHITSRVENGGFSWDVYCSKKGLPLVHGIDSIISNMKKEIEQEKCSIPCPISKSSTKTIKNTDSQLEIKDYPILKLSKKPKFIYINPIVIK